ncbi:MAG: transcription initiation factor alpha subunit family protein [Clostridiales bacterium]|jgi:hypothetical protein|nr:transcription initiation factor alpha subunit family protein [Clostridiales bacterium]
MRYQENFNNPMDEFRRYFNTMIQQLFTNTLTVEGETVNIPTDRELDYKLKYDVDEEGRSFTFKVSWDNEVHEDD